MEWSDSPITEAEEAELSESRTEERKIHGEMTSLQSEHLCQIGRTRREEEKEQKEQKDPDRGAEGAGREEKERREGGGPERKQFKAWLQSGNADMIKDYITSVTSVCKKSQYFWSVPGPIGSPHGHNVTWTNVVLRDSLKFTEWCVCREELTPLTHLNLWIAHSFMSHDFMS